MVMLRPSDADWWWNVALSGVLGTLIAAIVGAGIAIVGVRMALAHDRELAQTAADNDRKLVRQTAVATECRNLAREARSILDRIHDTPPPFLELLAWHREVGRLCNQVFMVEPNFRTLLVAAASKHPHTTLDPKDQEKIVVILTTLESILSKRAAGSEWFEEISSESLKTIEQSIEDGFTDGYSVQIG